MPICLNNVMDQLKILINDANQKIRTADHLTYMTYPLIKDPKIVIKIAENIHLAMKTAIEAVVYYDRLYKRISPLGNEFLSKYDVLSLLFM